MTLRIFIAVTHLLGVGHLARAAALARAFARSGHDATLVSGGMPAKLVGTDGIDFRQLPPLKAVSADFRDLRGANDAPADAALFAQRAAELAGHFAATRPDVVVTELFPFGRRALAAEFDALMEAASRAAPRPLRFASVRDILVAPARPERLAEAGRRLAACYDAVLVHGDPDLVPLDRSWPVDPDLAARLRYTGYVDEGEASPASGGSGIRSDEVVVSGGNSAVGLALFRTAIAAAAERPGLRWRILVGGGIEEGAVASLRAAAGPNVVVERARPDFRALLASCAVSVSQSGYNTCVDLLRTRTPAVLVPFEGGRETEQRERAQVLADRGYAVMLEEAALSVPRLLAAIVAARNLAPPFGTVMLDGASRSVGIVEEMLARRLVIGLSR